MPRVLQLLCQRSSKLCVAVVGVGSPDGSSACDHTGGSKTLSVREDYSSRDNEGGEWWVDFDNLRHMRCRLHLFVFIEHQRREHEAAASGDLKFPCVEPAPHAMARRMLV